MTGRLAHLFRHPIKAHGREELASVVLSAGAALPWDRHWAVAHAASKCDAGAPAWTPCPIFSAVRATGAQQGYVEVYGADRAQSVACGLAGAELDGVRARLSQGIVREAIASGATINTASARDDPRFSGFASVQAQRLRAVLCAPLVTTTSDGASGARVGVLYLEGRSAPGPFPDDDRALVELAARALAPNVERLL